MICELSDFRLEYALPMTARLGGNSSLADAITENVQDFIDEYEPKFLEMLLVDGNGDPDTQLIADLEAHAALPMNERDNPGLEAMIAQIKPSIAMYVAFQYLRNAQTQNTYIGEMSEEAVNAAKAEQAWRQVIIFNNMVDNNFRFYRLQCRDKYPDNAIFNKINLYNL